MERLQVTEENRPARRQIFVTGGTGYLGGRLTPRLLERGHAVRALAREHAANKLPSGCTVLIGNPLDSTTLTQHVPPADTLVHLVGVSRPAPWKAKQFRLVDFPSVQASLAAARDAGISHFVYVSVAQPAPAMKTYVQIRAECEALIRESGLRATILRPWYILGPGHYWPMVLLPAYWLMEQLPKTRESAIRLGLVTVRQMINALIWAIEHPAQTIRVLDVEKIRHVDDHLA